MTILAFVFVGVADILTRAEVPQHLPRGDKVIGCSGRDCEHSVLQAVRLRAETQDFFFAHTGFGHDVERQCDGALAKAGALGVTEREAGAVGVMVRRGRKCN